MVACALTPDFSGIFVWVVRPSLPAGNVTRPTSMVSGGGGVAKGAFLFLTIGVGGRKTQVWLLFFCFVFFFGFGFRVSGFQFQFPVFFFFFLFSKVNFFPAILTVLASIVMFSTHVQNTLNTLSRMHFPPFIKLPACSVRVYLQWTQQQRGPLGAVGPMIHSK